MPSTSMEHMKLGLMLATRSIQYAKVFIEDGKIVAVILREFTPNKMVEKEDWTTYHWPEAGKLPAPSACSLLRTRLL